MTTAVLSASSFFVPGIRVEESEEAGLQPAPPSLSEDEFTRFYEEHSRNLWAYICRMSSDPSVADDLTQKAFVRFLSSTLQSSEAPMLKAYLYRIATNLVYDHWRSDRRERAAFDGLQRVGAAAIDWIGHDLDRVLGRLEPKDRSLVWLAHVEELSHREIAEILDVREASVKVMLFRARKRLAAMLEEEGYRGGSA